MAKKKLFKSKTNFTLKRLHQGGSYGNIYERDYTTITNFPSQKDGQLIVYNGPSFKLTVTPGLNGQKKHKYGNWVTNPKSCGSPNIWTLNCMPENNTIDSKIVLKPNSKRLTDFACYGSAHDLIKSSLYDIILNFPAELYVTKTKLSETGIFDADPDMKVNLPGKYHNALLVENPFKIDILQQVIPDESVFSPLRYMCSSEYKYDVLDSELNVYASGEDVKKLNDEQPDNTQMLKFWTTKLIADKGCLINGNELGTATFGDDKNTISITCIYYEGDIIYLTEDAKKAGFRLRPNISVINSFFEKLSDFEKVLLNQYTDYTAIFETYVEDEETGWKIIEKPYKWPTTDGDWNLAINGISYTKYADELSALAVGYDTLFTDALWRDMVHESISNMDLTINSNGEEIDVNTSKMKKMLSIVGRQFDDIKKYIDNIKKTNSITYTQDGNTPDYFLPDNIELSGWESKEILNEIPNNEVTSPMYGARTIGYTAGDANNEFMRRLKLNSKQIFAEKGTKRCIEDLMAIFGYHSTDWLRRYYGPLNSSNKGFNVDQLRHAYIPIEYVYVAKGYANTEDPDTVCDRVKILNGYKDNYDGNVEGMSYDPYQGLPVAEVSYNNKVRLVPWFDKDCEYDSKMYFQMKGGWARNDGELNENGSPVNNQPSLFDYTISKIQYVPTTNELYSMPLYTIDENSAYYVGSIDSYLKVKDINECGNENGWEPLSDVELKQIETIVDTNKGNNPHTGSYDNGISYLEVFGELFRDSKFDNVRADKIEDKFDYGFNIARQADSTKCLFFSDGKENDDDGAALRGNNRIAPYNFFGGGEYDESASLSVINSKELHIVFDKAHQDFLEKDVLPYLKQIIPSTTIFSYSFEHIDGDDDKYYEARTKDVICDNGICPIYDVV